MRKLTEKEIKCGIIPHPLGWNAVIIGAVLIAPLVIGVMFGLIGFAFGMMITGLLWYNLPEETISSVSGNERVAVQNRLTWIWKEPKDPNGMSVFRFYEPGTMVILPIVHKIQSRFKLDHENNFPFQFDAEIEGLKLGLKGKGTAYPNKDRLQQYLSTDADNGSSENRDEKLREFFEEDLPAVIGDLVKSKDLHDIRGKLIQWNEVVNNIFLGKIPREYALRENHSEVEWIYRLARHAKKLADERGVVIECRIGDVSLPDDIEKKYSAKTSADMIAAGAYSYLMRTIGARKVKENPDPSALQHDGSTTSMELVWEAHCDQIKLDYGRDKKAARKEISDLWNEAKDDSKEDSDEFNRIVHQVKGISKENVNLMIGKE
jgi:hypothetical protein